MPDLLTDLARVRELMEAWDSAREGKSLLAAWAEYADACTDFLRTHASGIEAMARDAGCACRVTPESCGIVDGKVPPISGEPNPYWPAAPKGGEPDWTGYDG